MVVVEAVVVFLEESVFVVSEDFLVSVLAVVEVLESVLEDSFFSASLTTTLNDFVAVFPALSTAVTVAEYSPALEVSIFESSTK